MKKRKLRKLLLLEAGQRQEAETLLCQLCGQETVFGKFGPACPCCDFDNGIFCNHRSEAVCG